MENKLLHSKVGEILHWYRECFRTKSEMPNDRSTLAGFREFNKVLKNLLGGEFSENKMEKQ